MLATFHEKQSIVDNNNIAVFAGFVLFISHLAVLRHCGRSTRPLSIVLLLLLPLSLLPLPWTNLWAPRARA
jgi:hypothetical protein